MPLQTYQQYEIAAQRGEHLSLKTNVIELPLSGYSVSQEELKGPYTEDVSYEFIDSQTRCYM